MSVTDYRASRAVRQVAPPAFWAAASPAAVQVTLRFRLCNTRSNQLGQHAVFWQWLCSLLSVNVRVGVRVLEWLLGRFHLRKRAQTAEGRPDSPEQTTGQLSPIARIWEPPSPRCLCCGLLTFSSCCAARVRAREARTNATKCANFSNSRKSERVNHCLSAPEQVGCAGVYRDVCPIPAVGSWTLLDTFIA